MYTDEMMHAATKIMQNRADQLGLDDDELMHYGRKGMKWGKDIFAQDDSEKKQSGGLWGNNAVSNAINNPKYNPIKKAQLEKRKEELLSRAYESKPIKGSNGIKGTSHYTHGGDHDPMRPDWQGKLDYSNMSPYTGNRVSQETAGGRDIVTLNDPKSTYKTTTQNGLQVPKTNKEYYSPNAGYYTDRDVQPRIKQQEASAKYGSQQDNFSDEDRARGQAVRRQQAEERYNKNKAERMDEYEAIKPIKEGKTDTVLVGKDDALPVKQRGVQGPQRFFNPLADIAGVKDPFYTAQPSEITPYTDAYREAKFKYQDANGVRKDNLEKQKLRQTQNEQIAKYGNQQPEKNDEQRIAERARGQYIREEQKKQRQDELNKKKQELLEKARKERGDRIAADIQLNKNELLKPLKEGKTQKLLSTAGYVNGGDAPDHTHENYQRTNPFAIVEPGKNNTAVSFRGYEDSENGKRIRDNLRKARNPYYH